MGRRAEREVERLQRAGTRVIFDANVNYYEIWGDYDVPGTKPTPAARRAAIWMTAHADWVVADSSYLAAVARKYAPNVTWIPDNVDIDVYAGQRRHVRRPLLTLIWSGVAKKALHLRLIADVIGRLKDVELLLVCDEAPDLGWLLSSVPRRVLSFSDRRYAAALLDADVIISPKHLSNGYEMAHTEYKISLGMAVGLPAIASPQPSYVEAVNALGGGIIARSPDEWQCAIEALRDAELRARMGAVARRTIVERYSTPVVARAYAEVLGTLTGTVLLEDVVASVHG